MASHSKPFPGLPGLLAAWLFLVVLWLTWTPTGTGPGPVLLSPIGHFSAASLVGNVVLFMPLGAVLATLWVKRMPPRALIVRTTLLAAALSGIVESGQLWVAGRSTSPWDLTVNALGAGLAAGTVLWLIGKGIRQGWIQLGVGIGVWIGVLVFLCATGFAGSGRLHLSDWNAEHPIVAGNEWDADRAFRGTVSEPLICAGPAAEEVCATSGASPSLRSRLASRAEASQQVRVSARIRSDGPQEGLARIVTFSNGAWERNVTLGQEREDLVLRIRTPATGPNGTWLAFPLPGAVPQGKDVRVIASYRPGILLLEVGTDAGVRRGEFVWGLLSGWWFVKGPRVEPGSVLPAALVAAAAFAFPLGLAFATLGGPGAPPPGGLPPLLRLVAGAATAPALLVLLGVALDIPVPMRELGLAAGFGLLGSASVLALGARKPGPGSAWA